MLRYEDVKQEIDKLDIIDCSYIMREKHIFYIYSKDVATKIILDFSNYYAMSINKLKDFIDEYNSEIPYIFQECLISSIDEIIKNADKTKTKWRIDMAIWIALLKFEMNFNLREMYLEFIRSKN